MGVEGHIC
jgi:hypothetical protein